MIHRFARLMWPALPAGGLHRFARLTIALSVVAPSVPSAWGAEWDPGPAALHAQGVPGGEDSVSVRAVVGRSVVRPGDLVPVAVVLEHARGFHTWPHEPVLPPAYRDVVPVATDVEVASRPEGVEVGAIQWPEPVPVTVRYTGRPVELLSYVDTTAVYLPLELDRGLSPGEYELTLRVAWQACDERVCYFPQERELAVPLRVAGAGTAASAEPTEPGLFAGFDLAAYRRAASAEGGEEGAGSAAAAIPATMNAFGRSFSFDATGPAGLALLLVLAAVGGFLLNLTPCVLPLVPIKAMGLRAAAEGDASRLLLLGTSMSLGVVAFWLALGGAIAFVAGFDAISALFQTGWFGPVVGAVVAVAGLAMLGLLPAVRLPAAVGRVDPTRESVPGSFGFGVMTAVLSTPCTAPFMAGASAWAAFQRPAVSMTTFAAIGGGMALPYLLLSARPSWIRRIPRAGPASLLVKQVIGVLLLAVAAFFIGSAAAGYLASPPDPPGRGWWWSVGGLVAAAFAWLAWRGWRIATAPAWRASVPVLSLVVVALTLVVTRGLASPGPIDWVPFTPERFREAAAADRVVVMDFTAEWCLNCKALETGVLHREGVAELLGRPGVVPMRVDLTVDNPAGQAKLRELGWVGIPLLAVFGPGTGYDEPLKYDSYTPGVVREAVLAALTGGG